MKSKFLNCFLKLGHVTNICLAICFAGSIAVAAGPAQEPSPSAAKNPKQRQADNAAKSMGTRGTTPGTTGPATEKVWDNNMESSGTTESTTTTHGGVTPDERKGGEIQKKKK